VRKAFASRKFKFGCSDPELRSGYRCSAPLSSGVPGQSLEETVPLLSGAEQRQCFRLDARVQAARRAAPQQEQSCLLTAHFRFAHLNFREAKVSEAKV